jgi:hypothetical protein
MAANFALLRVEWRARTLAEQRAAAHATELCHWLVRVSFPTALQREAWSWAGDELDHAEQSAAVYALVADAEELPGVQEGALVLPGAWGRPTFERLVVSAADVLCVGEGLARPIYAAMREVALEPAPKQLLDRILDDVPRHAELGWRILDEAQRRQPELVSDLLAHHLPAAFGRYERAWGVLPDDWVEGVDAGEGAWGLIPRARYKREFFQGVTEDVLPKFDERNLPGRSAWGRRPKDKR